MKTILITDDDATLRGMYESRFVGGGLTVITAADGEEGLALALQKHPDVLLLDINMPKMDGLMVLNKLREDAWGKTVPVILLTNLNTDDKILSEIVKSEPSYYLVKDQVDPDGVFEKVAEVLAL